MRVFLIIMATFGGLFVIQIALSILSIRSKKVEIGGDEVVNKITWTYLAFSITFLALAEVGCMLYYFKLNEHNNIMMEFHTFLNTYRQTPRSRNIKKYKPPQEAIYEELSVFERSNLGSVY